MSEDKTCEVKESRVRELAEECSEYKRAMQILFPEALTEKCRNITSEIGVRLELDNKAGGVIKLTHYGEEVGIIRNSGIEFNHPERYRVNANYLSNEMVYYFQIFKK